MLNGDFAASFLYLLNGESVVEYNLRAYGVIATTVFFVIFFPVQACKRLLVCSVMFCFALFCFRMKEKGKKGEG